MKSAWKNGGSLREGLTLFQSIQYRNIKESGAPDNYADYLSMLDRTRFMISDEALDELRANQTAWDAGLLTARDLYGACRLSEMAHAIETLTGQTLDRDATGLVLFPPEYSTLN